MGDLAPVTKPGPPKAPSGEISDVTVKGSYRSSDGGLIRVEAVCDLDVADANCWGPDGKPSKALTLKVRDAIKRYRSAAPTHQPQLHFNGRKDRLLIFEISENRAKEPNRFFIQHTGTTPYSMPLRLPLDQVLGASIRHETYFISEELSTNTAVARIAEFKHLPSKPTLDSEPGTSISFGGETQTFLSTTQGGPLGQVAADEKGARPRVWTVKIQATNHGSHPLGYVFTPLDSAGKEIHFVDVKGTPIPDEIARKVMSKYDLKRDRQAMGGYFIGCWPAITSLSQEGDVYSLILAADPAKVAKFRIGGVSPRYISLSDIPLGPK